MKLKALGLFVLALISSALIAPPTASAEEMTNHVGKKVMVVGHASAIARWNPYPGAQGYVIKFRSAQDSGYPHAVRVSDKSGALTIQHLNSNVNYYYKVYPIKQGKEWDVWPEMVLYKRVMTKMSKPVLGATNTKEVNNQQSFIMKKPSSNSSYRSGTVAGATSLNYGVTPKKGWASVVWKNDTNGAVKHYHLHFWSSTSDRHALRNIPGSSSKVEVYHLNPNRAYTFRIEAVGINGKTWWVDGAQVLNVQ